MSLGEAPLRIVAISAGTTEPSTTRMLADRALQASVDSLRASGRNVTTQVFELAPMATDIARSLITARISADLQDAVDALATADGIVVSMPVYKAGMSGLFKLFVDLLDNDLLIAKPMLLAGTGGSARHAMVVDDHLRPLFAFMRALPVPTSVFASPEDWGHADLSKRIARAAGELASLMKSGVARTITDDNWAGYQHVFGGDATRAERNGSDIDLDSDLMRLARGNRP